MKKTGLHTLRRKLWKMVLPIIIGIAIFCGSVLPASGQHSISGTVTSEFFNLPLSGIEIFFHIKGVGPIGGTVSNENGEYYFASEEFEHQDIMRIQTWNYCNNQIQPYFFEFEIVDDTTQFDFQVCADEIPCEAEFIYFVESNEVSFFDVSYGLIYSWYWSFGDGKYSSEQNPVHTYDTPGVYNVDLYIQTENNCTDVYSESIIAGNPSTIEGEVFAGINPLPAGIVLLIDVADNYKVTDTMSVVEGRFSFTIDPFTEYLVLALPDIDPGIPHFPVYMPTYAGNTVLWTDAQSVSYGRITSVNISLVSNNEMFFGDGNIYGSFQSTGNKEIDNPMDPLPIFLFNEQGAPVYFAYRNPEDFFSFTDIPYGSYFVYPEKAGKFTYDKRITLSDENRTITGMQIAEDENQLEVIYNVGINTLLHNSISIAPNPFSYQIRIEAQQTISKVEVISVEGILMLQQQVRESSVILNTEHLHQGLYLLVVTFADQTQTFEKVIKH